MNSAQMFTGIFYSPETGLDAIFEFEDEMVVILHNYSDRLFLTIGAVVDLRFHGYQHLADSILDRAKRAWPRENWNRVEEVLLEAHQLKEAAEDGWEQKVYGLVSTLQPQRNQVPEDFHAYLLPPGTYSMVFARREDAIAMLKEWNVNFAQIVRIMVDLFLNDQADLLSAVEAEARRLWPDADWEAVTIAKQVSMQSKQTNLQGFEEPINFLISVTFQ